MALNREAKVMQRIEEICKGVAEKSVEMQWHGEARLRRAMEWRKEKLGKAMAMDARCGFDKQRQGETST